MRFAMLACLLSWSTLSNGQAAIEQASPSQPENIDRHTGATGFSAAPELENRPRSPFENSLMHELACTCGTCKLEPIDGCRCVFAAHMRGEVRAQLDELDVSTEEARRAAAVTVRASFVGRYGPKALDRNNRLDPSGRMAEFVVGAIALLVVVAMVRGVRSIRRGSPRADAE